MQKEEIRLQKRLIELSRIAEQKGIAVHSDFLNLNELHILHSTPKSEFYTSYEVCGGYECAERQMVTFLPDALCHDVDYQYELPMDILRVKAKQPKFAGKRNHRDYLGAILNLGLERCKIGDILVGESEGYVFVESRISCFVTEQLQKVANTPVSTEKVERLPTDITPDFEEIKGTVASVRLDSVMSIAYPFSRSKLIKYIESGSVFVNGKMVSGNAYQVKDGDIVSVRGLGKFAYTGMLSRTKKGRYYVTVRKYQ